MKINLYDKIKLTDGRKASIVEIYESGEAYEADIYIGNGEYETETIKPEDIAEVLDLEE